MLLHRLRQVGPIFKTWLWLVNNDRTITTNHKQSEPPIIDDWFYWLDNEMIPQWVAITRNINDDQPVVFATAMSKREVLGGEKVLTGRFPQLYRDMASTHFSLAFS